MGQFFEIVAGVLVLIGSFFVFSAAVGVLRMPDVYTRMHAATKAGTLGSGVILVGVALVAVDTAVFLRALAAVLFLVATTPIAAHLLGRAAYISGVPTWEGTDFDELAGRYDLTTRRLSNASDIESDGQTETGEATQAEADTEAARG
jgi:multicomponent Na+:H+ antiporter subunit G